MSRKLLNGTAVVSVSKIKWTNAKSIENEGFMLTPFAGKIPERRIIALSTGQNMGLIVGAAHLMSFSEKIELGEFDGKPTRDFAWANGGVVEAFADKAAALDRFGGPALIPIEDVEVGADGGNAGAGNETNKPEATANKKAKV